MKKSLSKLLALALALTMALSLTACGGGDKPAETPDNTNTIASSNDNPTEAPESSEEPVTSTPAESESVETPEQPEEPEVPSEIEVIAGETYAIENVMDITFGEMKYESIIVGDYPSAYQYRVKIVLPMTIAVTGSETIDVWSNAFSENFALRGYYSDIDEEFGLHMHFAGTNKIDKFESGNTYELECDGDTFYTTASTGTIKVTAYGKVFNIPYDYAEVLVPPTE